MERRKRNSMRDTYVKESEVYKLKDFITEKTQNLPFESYVKHWRYLALTDKVG